VTCLPLSPNNTYIETKNDSLKIKELQHCNYSADGRGRKPQQRRRKKNMSRDTKLLF
jgi:hypothetical protein